METVKAIPAQQPGTTEEPVDVQVKKLELELQLKKAEWAHQEELARISSAHHTNFEASNGQSSPRPSPQPYTVVQTSPSQPSSPRTAVVVVQQQQQQQQQPDRGRPYCGPISWLIGLFLFPCICFCPIDRY